MPEATGKTLWAGRTLSALPALFLVFDAVMKVAKPACTVLYVVPRMDPKAAA